MYHHSAIKKIISIALLLLFTLYIIPRKWLHETVTGHKHNYVRSDAAPGYQEEKNNFQCNFNEEVLISPFIDQPDFQLPPPVIVYASYLNTYSLGFFSTQLLLSSLRGPPALG